MNLHIHDHAVVSDGTFALESGRLRFYPAPEPSAEDLAELVERLVPLLRRAGKKAEARALQTAASPRPPDDPV